MQSTPAHTLIDAQSGLKFTKSPRWRRQKLLFLDIHDRCIKSTDMSGNVQSVEALPFLPGGFDVRTDGELIVGNAWQRIVYRWAAANPVLLSDLSGVAGCCIGDGVDDGTGGMYISDVGFDFLDPLVDPVPIGVIIHISVTGTSSVVARELFSPNGLAISPDNGTLIVAETLGHRLTAFTIASDGTLQDRRVWAQFENDIKPDGICLDREGAIWAATTGSWAVRVSEGGEIDQQVTTERPVFATTLGGPERRHLFMCTSASDDPVITRRTANATIDVVEVRIPGNGIP